MNPNFLFSRNTLPRHGKNFCCGSVSCYARDSPGKACPVQAPHPFTYHRRDFLLGTSSDFFPSNVKWTEHILTDSQKQAAPRHYWQETLDAGWGGIQVSCTPCCHEELPTLRAPKLNPHMGNVLSRCPPVCECLQTKTCSWPLHSLVFTTW